VRARRYLLGVGIAKGDDVYKVLARKYRPATLDEIIGQDITVRILKNAIKSNRLHHAILLSGPMGTGKTSTARIIAKSLNCEKGPTIDPCNKCESCMSVTKGNNVDVFEIDGASNRKVDDARSIIESIKYPPLKNRYKIYIIDEVHMLTQEAFNALLKTIEEPPEYVKFIFATTAVEKVPDTILSRCQILHLKRIPKDLIAVKLKMISQKEGVSIDDDALDIIAFASMGSLRVAEGYLDRCISYSDEHLTSNDVSRVVGVTDIQTVENYFDCIFKKNISCALEIINKLYNMDVNFEMLLQQFINYILKIDISKEYKAGLLNIYYKALLDIKQRIDEYSAVNVATYKAFAIADLDRIGSVIDRLLKGGPEFSINYNSEEEPKDSTALKDASEDIAKEDKNVDSNSQMQTDSNTQTYIDSEDVMESEGLKKVLDEFGGKVIAVEKLNK
jgi:DNA polymerase-3 subunit gamma/tau